MPESPSESLAAAPASVDDVVNCYRMLFGRRPDPDGLAHYHERLAGPGLSLGDLVNEFIGSVEFARAYAARQRTSRAVEVVATVEGFRLHLDPTDHAIGHALALTGNYEPEVTATLRRVLARGATLVDVGANVGWFSLLGASLVGPEGRVVAIEPNPVNVGLLQLSAKDNGYANIEAFAIALAQQASAVALETDGSNGRIIPIDGPPAQPIEASFVVGAYPLDDVLDKAGVSHVDVVKIDVEGAEPMVVRGAEATIARSRPVIISEFYPLALDCSPWGSARGYLSMLRELGYRLAVIGDGHTDGDDDGDTDTDDEAVLAAAARPGRDHVDLLARPF